MESSTVKVYKLAGWLGPLAKRYEDWLIGQNRIHEAFILHKTVEELNQQYFHDWNMTPFEVHVACRQTWIDAFMHIVQGFGYPNLSDVGYANDL